MKKEIVTFNVNGMSHEVILEPQKTLLEVLRDQLDLTGTKFGCGTGECGGCTVLINGNPALSCLTLAITAKDKQITTIEGLRAGDGLHPLQKFFIDYGAVQCGFCTPGMILTAKALLDENPDPTVEEVKKGLAGNLCRCTGYVKIIQAVMAAAEDMPKI